MQLMRVKEGEQHDNLHSHAQFAGKSFINSHSNICCVVSNRCDGSWIVDTCALDHMTYDLNQLKNLKPLPKHIKSTYLMDL